MAAANPRSFYGTPSIGGRLPGVQYPGTEDPIAARYADSQTLARGNVAQSASRMAMSSGPSSSDYSAMADVDPVWDMMVRGTGSVESDLRYAMRNNDRVKFDSVMANARKFRDEHIDEIRNIKFIAGQSGDPQSQRIVQMADAWDQFTWLDQVSVGVQGRFGEAGTAMTAADYMRQDKPSDVAMRDYQFGRWSADAFTNKDNPWYQSFEFLRDVQTREGAAGMGGAEGAKTSVAMQAKAFAGTYGRFMERHHDRFSDPAEAAVFGQQVLRKFGFDISSSELDSLSGQWKADHEFDSSVQLDDWMNRRYEEYDAARPTVASVDSQGKPVPNAGQANPLVSRNMMRANINMFHDIAIRNGTRIGPLDSTAVGAVRTWTEYRAALEKNLGFLPASMNDCVAKSAYGSLTGSGTDTRLKDLGDVYGQACAALGASYDSKSGDYSCDPADAEGALSTASQAMSRLLGRAYMASGLDYGSFMSALKEGGERANAIKRHMVSALLSRSDPYAPRFDESGTEAASTSAGELVDRYVGNVANGTRESLYAMLSDLASYNLVVPEANKVDSVSLDALGNDAVKPEDQGSRIKAYDSVKGLADGSSPLLASMKSEEDKAAVTGLAGDVLPKGYADKYVPSYESYVNGGKVALYLLDRDLNLGDRIPADVRKWIQTGDMFRFLTGEDKQVGFSQGDPALITMASSVAESLSKTLLTDQNLTSEEKAKLAGILIPVLASLPNRGGIVTEVPRLQQYSEALVQKVTGRKMYHQPTYGSSDLSSFYSRGVRPIELSDNEADEFRTQLMQGTSSWLGTEVPDTMRLVGAPLKSIGKKDPIDMRGVLAKAMSGLTAENAKVAAVAQDNVARAEKVEQGRDPGEADAERKGAPFRTYLSRVLSNDSRVNQFRGMYLRNVARFLNPGTDDDLKRIVQADLANIDATVRESKSYEDALRLIRPYLSSRPVYIARGDTDNGGTVAFSMMTKEKYDEYLSVCYEAARKAHKERHKGTSSENKFGSFEEYKRRFSAEQAELNGLYQEQNRIRSRLRLEQAKFDD